MEYKSVEIGLKDFAKIDVDIYIQYLKQLEIDKKEIEKEVKNEIYASFKKYNRKTSKMNLVKEKINKYKYIGQLNEFKLLKEEVSDAKKTLTFKNFKNLKSI